MAAMASKTGKVGFVGGMDIPLIRKFQCGYEQGVKHANPKADVFANMTGTTGAAWSDPGRGGELAKAQFAKGADVVFAAAGGTGIGVYQAAKDAGKLAIGVDSNQNHLQPGTMLTSMLKRVDTAVYNVAMGKTQAGITVLGLKEGNTAFDNLPFPTRPLYSGKPWFLPAVVAWYAWRDSREISRARSMERAA